WRRPPATGATPSPTSATSRPPWRTASTATSPAAAASTSTAPTRCRSTPTGTCPPDGAAPAALGLTVTGAGCPAPVLLTRLHFGQRGLPSMAVATYLIPGVPLIPQDLGMACWYASTQMLIKWRRDQTQSTESDLPDPGELDETIKLYKANNGLPLARMRE